ncbi:MAG: hypothetical protein ACREPU_09435 [Rhodanobacteraceae bacterium]
MPDQAAPEVLRIAMVFGDEAEAAHLREAMHGHADIVYATSAADFDATRMAGANVAATLVNLDNGDWLDAIEPSLDAAGVAVVYNDPEISLGLDGWGRARWLRHLLAKLSGSTDVDPPRPERTDPSAGDESAALKPEAAAPAGTESAVTERPLSPQEIETMTADFTAERKSISAQVIQPAPQPVVVSVDEPTAVDAPAHDVDMGGADGRMSPVAATNETLEPVQAAAIAADAPPERDIEQPKDEVSEAGVDSDEDMDVDTETLSAMIDARLADPESRAPSDSSEVWRVVDGGAEAPVQLGTVAEIDPTGTSTASEPARQPHVGTSAGDDTDMLASLPSLDEWQLVDPEAHPVPAATPESKNATPTVSDDAAGLELVPIETVSLLDLHSDPIERWLDDDESRRRKVVTESAAETGSDGGKA